MLSIPVTCLLFVSLFLFVFLFGLGIQRAMDKKDGFWCFFFSAWSFIVALSIILEDVVKCLPEVG